MATRIATLNEFIGQRRAITWVRRTISAARAAGRPTRSLLLIGPSGAGKTVMGKAIAREYAGTPVDQPLTNFRYYLAAAGSAADLVGIVADQQHGDHLLIDEAHALDGQAQEALFLALDDEKTFGCTEKGRLDRRTLVSIAAFTLILATNEPGKIKKPLRNRLRKVQFEPYTIPELAEIAKRVANELKLQMTAQAARHLAERSQGTPRHIVQLLEDLVDHDPGTSNITQNTVRDFLVAQGIDDHGLNEHQRQLLAFLAESPSQGARLELAAVRLGLDGAFVRTEIEPRLIELGLIQIARGRMLTPKGAAVASAARDAVAAVRPPETPSEQVN